LPKQIDWLLLVTIRIPERGDEEVRDLVGARLYHREKLTTLKSYLLGLCRRTGFHFKLETEFESHWTKRRLEWSERKVEVLTCDRGIDTMGAMCLISEIGDVNRFAHPHRLTSFASLDIRE